MNRWALTLGSIALLTVGYVGAIVTTQGAAYLPLGDDRKLLIVLWTPTPSPQPTPASTPRSVQFPPNTDLVGTTDRPFPRSGGGGFQVNFTLKNNSRMNAVDVVVNAELTDDKTHTAVSETVRNSRPITGGSDWRNGVVIPIAGWDLWRVWVEWRWRDPETGRLSETMSRAIHR